MQTDCAKKEEC